MPLYLVDYVLGETADKGYPAAWRPRGSEQPGWSAIKLGTSGADARALLWLPAPEPRLSARLLAEDKRERLAATARQRVDADLDIVTDARATTPQDLVATLLLDPPSQKWPALTPTGGQYEVWLGGELWARQPVLAGGSWYGSAFAATENPLSESGAWLCGEGDYFDMKSDSGKALGAAANTVSSARVTTTFSADQFAQAAAYLTLENTYAITVQVRRQTGTDESCYDYEHSHNGGPATNLRYIANGISPTVLASGGSPAGSGSIIKLTAQGSTLNTYIDGTLTIGPTTDTTLTSGSVAMMTYANPTLTKAQLDDFLGGDLFGYNRLTLLGVGA